MRVGIGVEVPVIGVEVGVLPFLAPATWMSPWPWRRDAVGAPRSAYGRLAFRWCGRCNPGVAVGWWVAARGRRVGVSIGVEVGGFALSVRAAVVAVAVGEAPGRSAFSPAADAGGCRSSGRRPALPALRQLVRVGKQQHTRQHHRHGHADAGQPKALARALVRRRVTTGGRAWFAYMLLQSAHFVGKLVRLDAVGDAVGGGAGDQGGSSLRPTAFACITVVSLAEFVRRRAASRNGCRAGQAPACARSSSCRAPARRRRHPRRGALRSCARRAAPRAVRA